MQTDPARVRRSDPGDPEKCPVWQLHKVYSDEETQGLGRRRLHDRGIGCLDCKQPVIDAIIARAGAVARARRAVPREPEARALDRRGRHRAGAHGRARDDARGARRDGAQLLTAHRSAAARLAAADRSSVARGGDRTRVSDARFVSGAPCACPCASRCGGDRAALLPSRLSVPASSLAMLALWRQISSSAHDGERAARSRRRPSQQVVERREHGGDQRGQRRIAEEERDDEPGRQRRHAQHRVDAEHHAGRSGDALAALEAEEHRPEVAEEGGEPDQRDRALAQAISGAEATTSSTGTQPFSASSSSVRMAAALLPERSTLVAPGLPDAVGARVVQAHRAADDDGERQRADQVGGERGEERIEAIASGECLATAGSGRYSGAASAQLHRLRRASSCTSAPAGAMPTR